MYWSLQQGTPDSYVTEIQAQGGAAYAHEADLEDPSNIPLIFDLCEEHLGPVDILISNHTYCVLETFDPERVTDDGFPVSLPTAEVIDKHLHLINITHLSTDYRGFARQLFIYLLILG